MKWRCNAPPPQKKRYLSDTCAIPDENKAKWVRYPPLRYYLERVLRDRGGGISHWAAKPTPCVRSGRGTVGRNAGPKWSKMVRTTILVKMTLFRTGFWHSRDQNGPKCWRVALAERNLIQEGQIFDIFCGE